MAGPERVLGTVTPPAGAAAPPRPDLVPVWPNLLFRELLVTLGFLVALTALSLAVNAPLEDPADPSHTPNPAKAPWYFVGLQELLVYFDPWLAGAVIPLLLVFGLCAIPYVDPGRDDVGVYTFRRRKLAVTVFLAGVLGWFALIAVGLWFRGPGWGWTWPGAAPPSAPAAEAVRSLPAVLGIPAVAAYFGLGGWWIARRLRGRAGFTAARRWTFALLLLAMAGTLLKILLHVAFRVRYIVPPGGSGFGL